MLAATGITKRFGPLTALDDVTISFARGEVHAVLGENGAGKTTLMNVLYGLTRPDAGAVELDGRALRLRGPMDAQAAGIGMVHQHFMLVEALTVAENVMLGQRGTGMWMPRSVVRRRAVAAAQRFQIDIDPDRHVEELSVGQRQRVELLRVLMRDATTLILDEPTAVLTPQETQQLFATIRRLREAGCRVLFISHKLAEVTAISDRVSVLRRGRLVCTEPAGARTASELAERMVGRRPVIRERTPRSSPGQAVLTLRNVSTDTGRPRLANVSLTVGAGEIVAVAGVDGNGQAELTRIILGLDRSAAGEIECRANRIAHIADDRQREALVLPMSLTENAALKDHAKPPLSRAGWLNWSVMGAMARGFISRFDIRAGSIDRSVAELSGGNQQKLVVARELSSRPELILAVNPTRGLDVAATDFVHGQLLSCRDNGAGILLISTDLDEVMRLADRVLVLYSGRLTPAPGPPVDVAVVGRLMAGLPADTGAAA